MRRFFLQNFSRRPCGVSQMIRKTVEKTLHAGRSFEGAQLTQLNRREFVQRGSFQLTDVNASRSVTQQESRHTRRRRVAQPSWLWSQRASCPFIFSGERRQLACGVRQLAEHGSRGQAADEGRLAACAPQSPGADATTKKTISELINADRSQTNQ